MSLIDRLKPSDGCYQNCVSWSDTSAALLRGEIERPLISWIELSQMIIYSCMPLQNEANFSRLIQVLAKVQIRRQTNCVFTRKISSTGVMSWPKSANSLGIFYHYTISRLSLGFPHGDECKVVGLAPYGRLSFLDTMRIRDWPLPMVRLSCDQRGGRGSISTIALLGDE